MKKLFFSFSGLLILATATLLYSYYDQTNVNLLTSTDNIEALAANESSALCYAGGPGATQCSIDAGIEIAGAGITIGCSVTCGSGYACCNINCTCVQ